MKSLHIIAIVISAFSLEFFVQSADTLASPSGDIVCGPVALKREGGGEFKRLDNSLIYIHVDDSVNQVSVQREFNQDSFKDAKFDGKLGVIVSGQRLDDSYPDILRDKFVLTLTYYHYTVAADKVTKIPHASGYAQGIAYEPLTGNADGDDNALKGAGATCLFFAGGATRPKN